MIEHRWEPPANAPLDELPLSFVDLETTGLSPHQGDRVCEVAIVQYIGDSETATFTKLVNPGRSISEGATAVNHITDEMVKDAPPFNASLAKCTTCCGRV